MDTNDLQAKHGPGDISINGALFHFDDPIVDVREALNAAGLTPASEFQAILVEKGRTHLLGTEDRIVFAEHPKAKLRVFPGDRSFSFAVNEIGQVWGAKQMETDELYEIWSPPSGQDWVFERVDEPDIVLQRGASVSFGPNGVEHIVARPRHGFGKLLVSVLTLSGVFPEGGGLRVDGTTVIAKVLEKAAAKLELADTSDWVVSVGGQEVSASQSFNQAGLSGVVEIEWMPREGGGGRA